MTSIGRQGWGSQQGIPGGLSMGKGARGARGGLPSVSTIFPYLLEQEGGRERTGTRTTRRKGREGRQPNLDRPRLRFPLEKLLFAGNELIQARD